MGEAGCNRHDFLYVLKYWEIRAIMDGYRRRERTFCVMTRWSTFMQMCTGMADLQKAGIHHADDLIKFPWETEEEARNLPSMEEVEDIRRRLQEENMRMGDRQ